MIGPSFSQELERAGLLNCGLSWTSAGAIYGKENLTTEQKTKLQQVLDAHDPTKPRIPEQVTAAQARVSLHRANLLNAVKSAVEQAGGEIEIWFEYATEWRRDSQHIAALSAGLGLTSEQIDNLFIVASEIK